MNNYYNLTLMTLIIKCKLAHGFTIVNTQSKFVKSFWKSYTLSCNLNVTLAIFRFFFFFQRDSSLRIDSFRTRLRNRYV